MQVTEATIDHIVNHLRTWLDDIPTWEKKDGRLIIDLPVKNEEDFELRFCALRNNTAVAIPRYSYLFNNCRIRGIDWHFKYVDVIGNNSEGWHEHIWSDKTRDNDRHPLESLNHIPSDHQLDFCFEKMED